ncbi:hypothetical protein BX286_0227 [Streptomyces sp. 3211.6]|uniref:RICIN domain-containing protein n=1 Tax=Streptomyces sp. 3211.6 TaxID=1938845 RepID=UPI000EB29E38|nr:RICIN domain-containing protein [Streptomyces sp. 3211.6]RKT02333.1 hypothetical protein BX286_0227 [Streptomyces sp. 3211.6]
MLDRFPPARRTLGVLVAACAAFTLAAGPARANPVPNQRWSRTDRNPDLIVGERFNGGPALCLDVTDWQTHNGAGVQIWDCHPAANQTWVWNIKQ